MRTRCTYKLAGRFSLCLLASLIAFPLFAAETAPQQLEWPEYQQRMQRNSGRDRIDGISYLISGSLALIGGLAGQNLSSDPLEKGVYTLFQTIGVASIGYGIYKWRVGDEERWAYEATNQAAGLSLADRASMIRSFYRVKTERERQERFMRALTHGLIAALNFYGATQQKNESVKNTLVFLGGVNALATVSFTF
jgi:hypothetical protein